MIDSAWGDYERKQRSENQRANSLADELADVNRQIANVADAVADTGGSAALLQKLHGLEKQQDILQANITAIESSSNAGTVYRTRKRCRQPPGRGSDGDV